MRPENEVTQGFQKSWKFLKMLKIRWFLSKSCIVEVVSCWVLSDIIVIVKRFWKSNIVELSLMSSAVSRRHEIQHLKQIAHRRSCRARILLSGMSSAVSLRRAGSDHRAVCHAEWFSSLLASRAVTMVDGLPRAASWPYPTKHTLRPIKVVITFSAPIRFASKVEISIAEVKTYPEMYLMSSGYSSGKSYAGEHDFQKVKNFEIFKKFRKIQKKLRKWRKCLS